MWSWLVANGLLRDLLAAAVGTAVTHVFGWRPWRAHRRRQERIIGLLDTGTPGGLADLLERRTEMPKIVNTGAPVTVDATPSGHAVQNSTDTYPADHKKAAAGGGGTG